MYTLPQEIEVWYIIPAIRKRLAVCMTTHHEASYEKAGKILGISKAAISQYIKSKRASQVTLHKDAQDEVCKSCELLLAEKSTATEEITRILTFIKKNKLPSIVCKKRKRGALAECKEIIVPDY